jgi:hypothetical protein
MIGEHLNSIWFELIESIKWIFLLFCELYLLEFDWETIFLKEVDLTTWVR